MSVDGRLTAPGAGAHRVAVLVALAIEGATLQRRLSVARGEVVVHQSGSGSERAARAAGAALRAGADALVSWGLAGGLDPTLAAGTVVLPPRVRLSSGESFAADESWRNDVAAALRPKFVLSEGDLVTVPHMLSTPESKRAAASSTGAVAADMESAAIAAVAARAGARFVAVRVIVDEAADSLPAGAADWIDERGDRRLTAAFGAALQPSQWRALWRLAQRYRVARGTLDRLAAVLLASRFCAAPAAAAVHLV
jgi:adenosylhomocysteine nucleosidase